MSYLNPRTNGPWLERRMPPEESFQLRLLAHTVIEAAEKLDERMLGPADWAGVNPAFESRTLLAMLAFCLCAPDLWLHRRCSPIAEGPKPKPAMR